MKIIKVILLFAVLFSLNSCIEIIDDITIKSDGSGTFKYNINLSDSKIKINSILALDSLNGRKVPSIEEIKIKVEEFKNRFENKEGISNVAIESNYTDFIFKLKCDFTSLELLQNSIHQIIKEEKWTKDLNELNESWILWDGQKLVRNIPDITVNKSKNLTETEIEQLKKGKYTSITRFDRPIEKFANQNAKLAPSKMAIMLMTNTYSLIQNINLLENTIYLSPIKTN